MTEDRRGPLVKPLLIGARKTTTHAGDIQSEQFPIECAHNGEGRMPFCASHIARRPGRGGVVHRQPRQIKVTVSNAPNRAATGMSQTSMPDYSQNTVFWLSWLTDGCTKFCNLRDSVKTARLESNNSPR